MAHPNVERAEEDGKTARRAGVGRVQVRCSVGSKSEVSMRLKSAVTSATRVLEVEDDPDIASFVALSLKSGIEGCQVTIAGDGDEAIAQALALHPHVILTNRVIPGPDGFEVTRRLRGDPEMDACQIVMLTANAVPSRVLEGLQAGADDYIVKPFDPEELLVRVRYALHLAEDGTRERAPRPLTVEDAATSVQERRAAAYAFAV
jgi:DNA-binding response OmpR family regulator